MAFWVLAPIITLAALRSIPSRPVLICEMNATGWLALMNLRRRLVRSAASSAPWNRMGS